MRELPPLTCAWIDAPDPALLLPALHEAEEDDARIVAALTDGRHAVLGASRDGEIVGAAVVRWADAADNGSASEIVYLGVVPAARRGGVGRALVAAVLAASTTHGDGRLEVGTANASIDNLAFYQRCGLRMDRIEPDHFAYVDPPASEHGIPLRDLVVFTNTPGPRAAPRTATGTPMFGSIELAAEIEATEADLMAACAAAATAPTFTIRIGGGVATFCGVGSPFTKVAGLGFGTRPTDAELAAVERAYADHHAPVSIELSTLADPAIAEMLGERGYRLAGAEHVLVCSLPRGEEPSAAPEIHIAPADDVAAWLALDVIATMHADAEGVAAHEEFDRPAIETALRQLVAAGSTPYLAYRDGVPAGAGSMRVAGRIAQLNGASTLPDHRRHGVQSAMLAARLAIAARAGAELATVTTQPGSRSQRNVERAGFQLLYARTILVKQPGA